MCESIVRSSRTSSDSIALTSQHQDGKEGTRLGLALVKELTSKMNGRVGVFNKVGQGTSFWFEFLGLTSQALIVDLLSPQSIANILNTFFVRMSAIIFEHGAL